MPPQDALCWASLAIGCAALLWASAPARAADPIKVGFSMALTGAVAPNGKQNLLALEIWRDDVNAKGGLLGRPVELVYYDDQSNPNNVPGIYTKLLSVDKVDLLVGPYATNMIAPAMPVVMQANKMTIGMLGVNVNRQFNYSRYFSMVPGGRRRDAGVFARLVRDRGGANSQAADRRAHRGRRRVRQDRVRRRARERQSRRLRHRLRQELSARHHRHGADRARHAGHQSGSRLCLQLSARHGGIVRAANEIGLNAKMFGGAMIGLLATPIKLQLGPLVNGLVIMESFIPAPKLNFPGLKSMLDRYQAKAPALGIDPLGYGFTPFAYAAGEVLAQAVEETKSLDHTKLADYIHAHKFSTVAGEISFGKDGEWTKSRQFFTQFQGVTGNDLAQFRDTTHQVILWPAEYKTGNVIYPYQDAKKK